MRGYEKEEEGTRRKIEGKGEEGVWVKALYRIDFRGGRELSFFFNLQKFGFGGSWKGLAGGRGVSLALGDRRNWTRD